MAFATYSFCKFFTEEALKHLKDSLETGWWFDEVYSFMPARICLLYSITYFSRKESVIIEV